MSKIKIIFVCLLVTFFALVMLICLKVKKNGELRQKALLAGEMHKVLRGLMINLSETPESALQDVPPDGLWHSRIASIKGRQGGLEYLARRQKENPDILEVRIKAQQDIPQASNLRIRISS